MNFYFLPIPIPGILADISRYLPILADISANFTDTDIEYFQHTDTRYRFPWIHTDTDTDYFETYRYRYQVSVSVSVSVSVYRLIPGIGRSLLCDHCDFVGWAGSEHEQGIHTGFTALAFPQTPRVVCVRFIFGFDFLRHHCPMAENKTCIIKAEIAEIRLQLTLVIFNTL